MRAPDVPRLLCFDLDGTLTDPAPGITACLQHAASALGRGPFTAQELQRLIGPPLRDVFSELFATNDTVLVDAAIRCYRERFSTIGLFENAVYPDVPPVLAELRREGYALRVVTTKPHVYANRIVDHFGLREFFPSVYGAELSGERSAKAELLAQVLEQEGVEPARVCMIGDRSHDVLGAKAHGIFAVGVTWGYGSREELESAGADLLIDAVAELPAQLASCRATVYDRNVDFYIDFVDRGLKSNYYLPLLTLMTDLIGARLEGARVCDLCCGEGYLGRHLMAHGAQEVLGIDASAELLDRATARATAPNLSYRRDDAQALSSIEDGTFDVVASQLAMQDVADHRALFAAVRRVLVPQGVFVFSTLHPCFKARPFHVRDAPENFLDEKGQPIGVVIRRYASEGHFNSGGDGVRGHMGSYHRMLSSYVNDLIGAGFVLERLEEPLDGPANGALFSEVPMVLVVAARAS